MAIWQSATKQHCYSCLNALTSRRAFAYAKDPAFGILHAAGFSQLINHGIPNRSTTLPNRSAQKVSAIGIFTVPSSARALKMRSASLASLGLNITQKLCGFLYSPGMASQPSNTPSPTASPACRIFLAQPGGAWPGVGE